MRLSNQTPFDCNIHAFEPGEKNIKSYILTLKATFSYDEHGNVSQENEAPYPIFQSDKEVSLGILPKDVVPRFSDVFEVILLGVAYTPGGVPAPHAKVTLIVDGHGDTLEVFGLRKWEGFEYMPKPSSDLDVENYRSWLSDKIRTSPPEKFVSMPLTLSNAYGGKGTLYLDKDSKIEISDQLNPLGKGFYPLETIFSLAVTFDTDLGYPHYVPNNVSSEDSSFDFVLPNIERENEKVLLPGQTVLPATWSTVPMDSVSYLISCIDNIENEGKSKNNNQSDNANLAHEKDGSDSYFDSYLKIKQLAITNPKIFFRAQPQWTIPIPSSKCEIEMHGLHSFGSIKFNLPELRVFADYHIGAKEGSRELVPQSLVLLPEERKFYIVYRWHFFVENSENEEKSIRIISKKGWYKANS